MGKQKKVDPLWDAFLDVMGIAPGTHLTPSASKTYNAKHQELRATVNPLHPHKVTAQELRELAVEFPRRAAYYATEHPKWPFTIPAIVKHWATLTPKRTSKEIFEGFANAWCLKNIKALSGLDPLEMQRLYLKINRVEVCKRWPMKSSVRGYIDRLMKDTLQYCCDLSPQQIKPHVAKALEELTK